MRQRIFLQIVVGTGWTPHFANQQTTTQQGKSAIRTLTSYKRNWMLPLINILGFVALFPLLVLIGCVSITTEDADGTGSHEENQKHMFEVGDNPIIDVTGYNGDIEIVTGSDKGEKTHPDISTRDAGT